MRKNHWTFLAALALAGSLKAEPFDVAVPGPKEGDPLLLQGDYTPPTTENAPVLVCLHGLGSARSEWAPLLERAHARGWGSLAYDLRGHGRSRGTLAGLTVDYEDKHNGRNPAFWQLMPGDLERVLSALTKKMATNQAPHPALSQEERENPNFPSPLGGRWPEGPDEGGERSNKLKMSRERITLVGASLGANICLTVASRAGGRAVLLSPGLDYAGLATDAPMAALKSPALLIVAKPDAYAFLSAERLVPLAPKGLLTFLPLPGGTPRGDHGAQLFDGKLENKILDWVATGKLPSPKR